MDNWNGQYEFGCGDTFMLFKYFWSTVATSTVVLRWLSYSPRTGCAWRIKPLYMKREQAIVREIATCKHLPIVTCERLNMMTSVREERLRAWSLLLLAVTMRSFAHMPLGISYRNSTHEIWCPLFCSFQSKT